MTDLVLKNVEEAVVHELEVRAAHHGHSVEEELRHVLGHLVRRFDGDASIKRFIERMPAGGDDRDFERNPDCGRTVEL